MPSLPSRIVSALGGTVAPLPAARTAPAATAPVLNPGDPKGLGAATGVRVVQTMERQSLTPEASGVLARRDSLNRRLWAVGDQLKRGTAGGDPILQLIRRLPGMGVERDQKLLLFETLRETLPVLNAAILKRRFIEGQMVLTARDPGLQRAIREFAQNVPVQNYAVAGFQTGLDVWLDFVSENADTLGMGIGEVVVENGSVARVLAPHPRTFYWKLATVQSGEGASRRERDEWKLFQKRKTGQDQEINSPFVKILAFSANPSGPGGRPVAWGLPFVAEILIRIFVSMNNLWHRAGDPSYLHQIQYAQRSDGSYPSTTEIDADALLLDDLLAGAYAARSVGLTADAIMGLSGGKIVSEALGGNPSTSSLAPHLQEQYQVVAGQVIANSDVPPWAFPAGIVPSSGLNSNREEVEAAMALGAGATRNERRARLAQFAIDQFLILDGSPTGLGRYEIGFEQPSLSDPKAQEEARAARANANATEIDNALLLQDSGVLEGDDERDLYLATAGVIPTRTA